MRRERRKRYPENFLEKLKTPRPLRTSYFHMWKLCGEKWGSVKCIEDHWEMEATSDTQCWRWMTEPQLVFLYHDAEFVNQLCAAKLLQPGLTRPHLEVPNNPCARQYRVLVEDEHKYRLDKCMKKNMRFEGELDNDKTIAVVDKQLGETEDAFKKQKDMGASAAGDVGV